MLTRCGKIYTMSAGSYVPRQTESEPVSPLSNTVTNAQNPWQQPDWLVHLNYLSSVSPEDVAGSTREPVIFLDIVAAIAHAHEITQELIGVHDWEQTEPQENGEHSLRKVLHGAQPGLGVEQVEESVRRCIVYMMRVEVKSQN